MLEGEREQASERETGREGELNEMLCLLKVRDAYDETDGYCGDRTQNNLQTL